MVRNQFEHNSFADELKVLSIDPRGLLKLTKRKVIASQRMTFGFRGVILGGVHLSLSSFNTEQIGHDISSSRGCYRTKVRDTKNFN